jgi:predicted metal-dependent hydrolase
LEEKLLPRFKLGIEKFNSHEFYDCHDILEDVWFDVRGSSRRFYQGLIHIAVGFYHITIRKNPKGALSQLNKALEKLLPYSPSFQGVELENLLKRVNSCKEEIKKAGAESFDISTIPKIEFDENLFVED